jgi:hypothetical protein
MRTSDSECNFAVPESEKARFLESSLNVNFFLEPELFQYISVCSIFINIFFEDVACTCEFQFKC